VVHSGANAVFTADFMDGVDLVAVKQDALGKGGFPRVDMCTDSNVPHLSDICPVSVDAHSIPTPSKRRLKRSKLVLTSIKKYLRKKMPT
jgi:hypothetical protein